MWLAAASLATITAFVAALIGLVAAIAGLVAIPEYRRRMKAQRAELDTQLAQLFAQLVPIADGHGPPMMPDAALTAAVEKLVAEGELSELRKVLRQAYVAAPVGAATQAAAISSIVHLGCVYDSLISPAEACLASLSFDEFPLLEQKRVEGLERLRAKLTS